MNDENFARIIATIFMVFVVAASLATGYFVDESEACRAAASFGMSSCRVTSDHRFFASVHGCGHDDVVAFDISATNSAGQPANMVVCCGLFFKGCTMRTP